MELLILLIQRHGELVSRDEIARHIWGGDVFLDVDHNINTAIRKIRQALHDDPEKPRFLETIIGKGYRFAAPVLPHEEEEQHRAEMPVDAQGDHGPRILRVGRWLALGLAAGLALAIVYIMIKNHPNDPTAPKINSLAVLPLKTFLATQPRNILPTE
jgi:hypothetical protein